MKKAAFILVLLSTILKPLLFGQVEFLVSIDPTTLEYTRICSIPGVTQISGIPNLTTFNENRHTFIFGGNKGYPGFIYSVDVNTAEIVAFPPYPFSSNSMNNLTELECDSELDTIFGLHWNNTDSMEYFVTLNSYTGEITIIDSLPEVKFISGLSSTYDQNNHRYIFIGLDSLENFFLYSIDAITGDILSNPPFPVSEDTLDNISEILYDNSSGRLYGLFGDYSEQSYYLISIDIESGAHTFINKIIGLSCIYTFPRFTTFDELNQLFIFRGGTCVGPGYLYSIDVNSGTIVSQVPFPEEYSNPDYLTNMQCDNTTGKFYALLWDANYVGLFDFREDLNNPFSIAPNPFQSFLQINLNKNYHEIRILLYDMKGNILKKVTAHDASSVMLLRDDLLPGNYLISVTGGHQMLGSRKIVVK